MIHPLRHVRSARHRPAWVMIVAALWLVGGIAPCALASPGVAASVGEEKHRCPCGMDCGSVCCCKHKAPGKPKPLGKPKPGEAPARTPAKAGPCMGMAPCGGALPPGTSAVVLAAEKADCVAIVAFSPAFASSPLIPPGSDRREGLVGSPPDEPPERRIDA